MFSLTDLYRRKHIVFLDHDEHPNQELELLNIQSDMNSIDQRNQFHLFKLYFSIAAFAVITTLLNKQNPLLSSFIA